MTSGFDRKIPGLLGAALVLSGLTVPASDVLATKLYKAPGCEHKIRHGSTQVQVTENCGPPDSSYIASRDENARTEVIDRFRVLRPSNGGPAILAPVIKRRPPRIINFDVWVYDLGANCKHCSPWSLRVIFREGRVVGVKKVREKG